MLLATWKKREYFAGKKNVVGAQNPSKRSARQKRSGTSILFSSDAEKEGEE